MKVGEKNRYICDGAGNEGRGNFILWLTILLYLGDNLLTPSLKIGD